MGDKKYSSPRARAEAFTGALGTFVGRSCLPLWRERALPRCRLPSLTQAGWGPVERC